MQSVNYMVQHEDFTIIGMEGTIGLCFEENITKIKICKDRT
jgi:hypothetical protein